MFACIDVHCVKHQIIQTPQLYHKICIIYFQSIFKKKDELSCLDISLARVHAAPRTRHRGGGLAAPQPRTLHNKRPDYIQLIVQNSSHFGTDYTKFSQYAVHLHIQLFLDFFLDTSHQLLVTEKASNSNSEKWQNVCPHKNEGSDSMQPSWYIVQANVKSGQSVFIDQLTLLMTFESRHLLNLSCPSSAIQAADTLTKLITSQVSGSYC